MCKSKSIWRHYVLCQSIIQLKQQHKNELFNKNSYQTACSMKDKPEVAKLVGEKSMLQCRSKGIVMPVLMDTGLQVSIMEKRVLEERFPDNKIKSVEDLLNNGDNLRVQWGNSHDIPFRGFVELPVTLGEDRSLQKLNILFLVTTERLNKIILGFNAIKMLAQLNDNLELLHEMIY